VNPGGGMILALETSQRTSWVALGPVLLESHCDAITSESIDTQNRLVEDVLPAIQRLCARANITRDQIGAVALNSGPGGFSGLRIAHAAAQSIAESLSIAIVQVSAAVVARQSAVLARNQKPEQLAGLAAAWGVKVFIAGHAAVPEGVAAAGEQLLLLNSDHEHGAVLALPLSCVISNAHELALRAIPIGSIEGSLGD